MRTFSIHFLCDFCSLLYLFLSNLIVTLVLDADLSVIFPAIDASTT